LIDAFALTLNGILAGAVRVRSSHGGGGGEVSYAVPPRCSADCKHYCTTSFYYLMGETNTAPIPSPFWVNGESAQGMHGGTVCLRN